MNKTDPEQVKLLRSGVDAWNSWRKKEKVKAAKEHLIETAWDDEEYLNAWIADLYLCMPELRQADLSKVAARNADLAAAQLWRANFQGADLKDAVLFGAELIEVDFSYADLSGANLRGADLSRAKLIGTRMDGAQMGRTRLEGLDLSGVVGLETVKHYEPSPMTIGTLYKSNGKIPREFLVGIGIPDNFIDYIRSLVGSAVEFFSCFISYSTKDQEFADRLYADLQAKGVRCWFAPHNISSGKKIHEQIDQAIHLYDRLLLIVSAASMASEWVKTEIAKARKRELNEQRQVLFPIMLAEFDAVRAWECFDADTGKDSAREIREYFMPDFSRWKDHDCYLKAFEGLLRDLKASCGA